MPSPGVSVIPENMPGAAGALAMEYVGSQPADGYTIGFDGSGRIFHQYRVYALPTQFFIDENGVISDVAQGPLTSEAARAYIERILPPVGAQPTSPSPSP